MKRFQSSRIYIYKRHLTSIEYVVNFTIDKHILRPKQLKGEIAKDARTQ